MFAGKHSACFLVIFFLVSLPFDNAFSQESDAAGNNLPKKDKTFWQVILKPITRSGTDSTVRPGVIISKNEALFLPYEGIVSRFEF